MLTFSKCVFNNFFKEQFAAEVHFVHFNTKYGTNLGEAITEGDGEQDTLAVLGVFLEIGHHNDAYESITSGKYNRGMHMALFVDGFWRENLLVLF
jgi:carbonic anhydrase